MIELTDGVRARLVVRHGVVQRSLAGTLRRFEQDGEERWEIRDVDEDRSAFRQAAPGAEGYEESQLHIRHVAVGIVPSNVVSIDQLD